MPDKKVLSINHFVLFGLLGLLPLINILDISALTAGGYKALINSPPPQLLKLLKDFGYWSLLLTGLYLTPKERWLSSPGILFISGCVLTALIFISTLTYYPEMAYFGLRWLLPLLLIFPLMAVVSRKLLTTVAKICSILFLVHLSLQALQWLTIGSDFSKLLGRPPGLFSMPNTAALFSLFSLLLVHFYVPKGKINLMMHALVPISLLLTRSGTGFFCWLLFIGILGFRHLSYKRILLLLPLFTWISWQLMLFVVARNHYVEQSLWPRFEFFKAAAEQASIWPHTFGAATHASWFFYPELRETILPMGTDSTPTSILYNTQWLGFGCGLMLYVLWLKHVMHSKSLELMTFTLIVSLFAVTTDLLDVFPVNLLIALVVSLSLKQNTTSKLHPASLSHPY